MSVLDVFLPVRRCPQSSGSHLVLADACMKLIALARLFVQHSWHPRGGGEEESEIAARFNVHVDLVERLSRIWVSARAAKPSDSLNPPSTSFPRFVEFTISLVLTCFQCAGDADTAACSLFVQRDTTNIETALSLAETAS
jgi:hypothetical protein